MQLDEPLHERKPDAEAARFRIARHEQIEDPGGDVGGDARSFVGDPQHGFAALRLHADRDRLAGRGELQGVVE